MTREDIFSMAEGIAGSCADQPFEGDFSTYVFRHTDTKKWFGILMQAPSAYFYGKGEKGYTDCVTFKCEPVLREILMQNYEGIYPAWHMNKVHWATVVLDSPFPIGEMEKLLALSFELTKK